MAACPISGSEMPRKRRLLGDDLGIDVPLLQMFSVDQETGQVSAKAKERERKAEERAKREKEVAEKKSGNATVGATSALVASTDLDLVARRSLIENCDTHHLTPKLIQMCVACALASMSQMGMDVTG